VTDTEVVIQGGGTAALATALGLARGGLAVTLLDGAEYAGTGAGDGSAGPALPSLLDLAGERVLQNLGAWPRIRAQAIDTLALEDAGSGRHLTLSASEIGERRLGHVVEAGALSRTLREVLDALPGTRRLPGAAVDAYTVCRRGVTVQLSDGRQLSARVLVGADGPASGLRRLAGLGWRRAGHGQEVVIAQVRTRRAPGATLHQRLQGDAPLTLLPSAAGECTALWAVPRGRVQGLCEADEAAFAQRLGAAGGELLGPVEAVSSRRAATLQRGHAERYTGQRLALVGDAADTGHPLGGQAVSLALLDAATLAESLLEARDAGRDPGGTGPLRRYERRRWGDRQRMQTGLDALLWALSTQHGPLPPLRGLALRTLDASAPLRRGCLRTLLSGGHGPDLPALARGPRL